jgi:hypothetical protein
VTRARILCLAAAGLLAMPAIAQPPPGGAAPGAVRALSAGDQVAARADFAGLRALLSAALYRALRLTRP